MRNLGARQVLLGAGIVASFCAVLSVKTALAADLDINVIKAKIPAEIKVTTDNFTNSEKIAVLKKIVGSEAEGKLNYDAASSPDNIIVSLTEAPDKKFEVRKDSFKKSVDLKAVAAHYVDSGMFRDNVDYQKYLKGYVNKTTNTTGDINMPITKEYDAFVVVYRLGAFGVDGKEPINQIITNLPAGAGVTHVGEPALPNSGQIMTSGVVDGKTVLNFLSKGAYPGLYAYVTFYIGDGSNADMINFDPMVKKIKVKSLMPGGVESEVAISQYTGVEENIKYDIPEADIYNQYYLSSEAITKADTLAVKNKLTKQDEVLFSYDFKVKSRTSTAVNLTKNVKVSIPVSQEIAGLFSQNRLVLYHIKADNTNSKVNFKVEGGFLTFETKDFSEFTLVRLPEAVNNNQAGTGQSDLGAPNAGYITEDKMFLGADLGLAFTASAIVVIVGVALKAIKK